MNDNKGFKKRPISKFLTIIISSNLDDIFSLKGLLSNISDLLSFRKWGCMLNETDHIVTEVKLCNKNWWQKVVKYEAMQQKLLTSCWRVDIAWKNTSCTFEKKFYYNLDYCSFSKIKSECWQSNYFLVRLYLL